MTENLWSFVRNQGERDRAGGHEIPAGGRLDVEPEERAEVFVTRGAQHEHVAGRGGMLVFHGVGGEEKHFGRFGRRGAGGRGTPAAARSARSTSRSTKAPPKRR